LPFLSLLGLSDFLLFLFSRASFLCFSLSFSTSLSSSSERSATSSRDSINSDSNVGSIVNVFPESVIVGSESCCDSYSVMIFSESINDEIMSSSSL